ncbi:MAG: hypothetical protein LBS15_02410 [Endomicrobium sp.]|jgi:TolA-binding protein|nr:hypothetical protein [Endomicrobium sp.]
MQFKILPRIFNSHVLNGSLLSIACFVVVFVAGCCTLSGYNKIVDLTDEISQLNIKYREFQQNYADLCTKISTDCEAFDASIRDLQNKVFLLSKPHLINGVEDEPSSSSCIYGRAYGDYLAKKYKLAYSGFESFVSRYPNDVRAVEARLYMDECLKMFDKEGS